MAAPNPCTLTYNGQALRGQAGQPLVDFLAEHGIDLLHVCYHPTLGALQTCDVCWLEVNGELVRGCAVRSAEGLSLVS